VNLYSTEGWAGLVYHMCLLEVGKQPTSIALLGLDKLGFIKRADNYENIKNGEY